MIMASNFGQKIQTASSFNWNNMREIHNNSICVYIVVNKFLYRNKKKWQNVFSSWAELKRLFNCQDLKEEAFYQEIKQVIRPSRQLAWPRIKSEQFDGGIALRFIL